MAALLLAALLSSPRATCAAGETPLALTVFGKPLAAAEARREDGRLYLDAARLGDLVGGRAAWYPVSRRLELSLRGRRLRLAAGSSRAEAGGEVFEMEGPLLIDRSRAFVPLSLLLSEEFRRWSGTETSFDEGARALRVERAATVGPAALAEFSDRVRVSVELADGASWRAKAAGAGRVDIFVEFGVARPGGRVEAAGGAVESYELAQEAGGARLSVALARPGLRWKATELSAPRRAAIEVERAPAEAGALVPAAGPRRRAPEGSARKARRLVVVDAGHGGKDPGATSPAGTFEKDVNLEAARELVRALRRRGDFDVLLSRDDDSFVPLADRSALANDREADLFVSLHCNAARNPREEGFEIYSVSETATDPEAERLAAVENAALAYEGKDPEDEMASLILLAMTKTEMINESSALSALAEKEIARRVAAPSRGAKQAAFYVLRGTHAPAILVEMGFLSHRRDEARLRSRDFQRALAEGVAEAVAGYARRKGWGS